MSDVIQLNNRAKIKKILGIVLMGEDENDYLLVAETEDVERIMNFIYDSDIELIHENDVIIESNDNEETDR